MGITNECFQGWGWTQNAAVFSVLEENQGTQQNYQTALGMRHECVRKLKADHLLLNLPLILLYHFHADFSVMDRNGPSSVASLPGFGAT